MRAHMRNIWVSFVCQSHLVKLKVTEAKQRVCVSCLRVVDLRLKGILVYYYL